ncbi:hypothetical protein GCK72_006161 [Caenorhabditis remanei]|uniref:Uncharacterized protein n=1 Tax=Caenorhabditis remanei TaxID=31234 RepID=E3LRD9_CAERE|nr:hypothetical protein GCK72_006161 [Caenorhabditis remanei]EFP07541.1 hypothetical protein CRE_26581 [Caenorhabditis remanei]KAF1766205.1 hypothetical protein GCK72_006161 [Caenorhabditis remanei]
MKLLALLVLTVLIASATASYRNMDANARLLKEMEMEMELEDEVKQLSRARRVPAGSDTRSCGRKLVMYVIAVCGEVCNSKTGVDIATHCCGQQCSDDYIRTTCCPQ